MHKSFTFILLFLTFFNLVPSGYADNSDDLIENLLNQGKNYMQNNNYESAISQFDVVLQKSPKSLIAFNNKAVALYRLGRCKEAGDTIEIGLQHYPNDSGLLLNDLLISICINDNARIKDRLEQLSVHSGDDAILWYTIGLVYRDMGNYSASLQAFDRAINLNLTYGDAWAEKASVLTRIEKYDDAYQTIQQAITLNPDDNSLLYNRGVILERLGKFREALDTYNIVTDRDPSHYKAFFNKGSIYWNHYRLNESLNAFENTIRANPNLSDAWFFKGLTLKELGRINESANAFTKAAELSPKNTMYQAYAQRYKNYDNSSLSRKGIIPFPWLSLILSIGLSAIIFNYNNRKKE